MRGHDKSGIPFPLHIEKQFDNIFTVLRIKIARGLIGKNNSRIIDQGTTKSDSLFLPSGKLIGETVSPLPDTDPAQQFTGLLPGLGIAAQFRREHDIFDGIQRRHQMEGLKDETGRPVANLGKLVRGRPIYSSGVDGELLTPTGAAILTTLADDFGPLPPMTVDRIGHGAGTADRSIANMLRVFIGSAAEHGQAFAMEQTATIETTIDDMNPQIYDHLMERALSLGAMDIFKQPVQMKKNRSGTLVTILCHPEDVNAMAGLLFRETTTIGLRWRLDNRFTLQREFITVDTDYGPIACKTAMSGGAPINVTPEYDDCKRAALVHDVPLKAVINAVRCQALAMVKPGG